MEIIDYLVDFTGKTRTEVLAGVTLVCTDGSTIVIESWSSSLGPKPTQAQINAAAETVPTFTVAEQKAAISAAVSDKLESTAVAKGFRSSLELTSYKASTNSTWADQASAFVTWQDSVRVVELAALAAVTAPSTSLPNTTTLIAELPTLVWPVVDHHHHHDNGTGNG